MCLERYIVEQCAPTLASIKTGALFGVIDPDTEELLRQAEHWRERLAGKGLALRVLRCRPGRALIYLGRLSQLERDLASSGAAELLGPVPLAPEGVQQLGKAGVRAVHAPRAVLGNAHEGVVLRLPVELEEGGRKFASAHALDEGGEHVG